MKKKLAGLFMAVLLLSALPAAPAGAAGSKNAQPATDAELEQIGNVETVAGANVQIINGELYMWGLNDCGRLGITQTVDPKTKEPVTVSVGDTIFWPMKLEPSKFGNKKIEKVLSLQQQTFAVTQDGELYGWGRNYGATIIPDGPANILEPVKVPGLDGKRVLEIRGYINVYIKVQEKAGDIAWYAWGNNKFGECGTGNTELLSSPTKLKSDLIPEETIADVAVDQYVAIFLTQSGKVYGIGSNARGGVGNNCGSSGELVTNLTQNWDKSNVLTPVQINFNGKKITQVKTATSSTLALDVDGCVWSWGWNGWVAGDTCDSLRGSLGLGEMSDQNLHTSDRVSMVARPVKVFGTDSVNPATAGKKVRKLYGYCDAAVVLCENNEAYGWGYNPGFRIYSGADQENYKGGYPYPNRVFEEVSQKDTIVGVFSDQLSFSILTRSGDRYFVGNAAFGGRGDGTTASTTEPVLPDRVLLPPIKPTTKNKISMDIVYTKRDGELDTITGDSGKSQTAYVTAGQKFTVQVYFEDFAKLDQFTLPLKFTEGNAKVVYKAGAGDEEYKAYAGDENEALDQSNIPAFGTGTGIQSNVRDSVWPGGELYHNESYPRINNKKGYLSVYGKTTQINAPIAGRQLMFSVDFIATQNGDITFTVLDAEENSSKGDPILARDSSGAAWQIVHPDASPGLDLESYFEFNEDASAYFPKVNALVRPLNSLALSFYYLKNGSQQNVADKAIEQQAGDETQKREYFSIDKDNSDVTYVVRATPDPTDATDAAVEKWDITFDPFTGKNPTDREISDYIEIIQQGTRTLTFKMPEMSATTQAGYFTITAKKSDMDITPVYVQVTSLAPPKEVKLTNAGDCPNPFLVNAPLPGLDLPSTFTFEAKVTDQSPATGNTNVTWSLYSCTENEDGTVTETAVANNDLTAPAVLGKPAVDPDDPMKKSVMVTAQRSTPKGTYMKLVAASTADGSVKDEAAFRVELLATDLVTEHTLYLGTLTSRTISVSADPFDAYEPEYEYRVADDSPAAQSSHGSYITVSENGIISAGDEYSSDESLYDEVIITEKKSNAYYNALEGLKNKSVKRIKVFVRYIVAPPDMDVTAQNNVGTDNDKAIFKADLKAGDKLTVYKKYMDASSVAEEYASLSASDITILKTTGFVFEGGLDNSGGTIGYLVERSGSSFTEVPVNYSAEPCVLKGYARLEGKMPASAQNSSIAVEITGLRDADGNPIPAKYVQDETGYFEFENYVPVGTYTIKISRELYMTRYVTITVTQSRTSADIIVSTLDNPIYLSPGDLGNPKNGKLDPAEFNSYLYNWFGKVKARNADVRFDDYNFAELSSGDSVIGMRDVGLLLKYYNRDNIYADWSVTQ